jgi:hypothetical protein
LLRSVIILGPTQDRPTALRRLRFRAFSSDWAQFLARCQLLSLPGRQGTSVAERAGSTSELSKPASSWPSQRSHAPRHRARHMLLVVSANVTGPACKIPNVHAGCVGCYGPSSAFALAPCFARIAPDMTSYHPFSPVIPQTPESEKIVIILSSCLERPRSQAVAKPIPD